LSLNKNIFLFDFQGSALKAFILINLIIHRERIV